MIHLSPHDTQVKMPSLIDAKLIDHGLQLTWRPLDEISDQEVSLYDWMWLQDHDQSEKSVHPSTRQRLVEITSLSSSQSPQALRLTPDPDPKVLILTWDNGRETHYSLEFLADHRAPTQHAEVNRVTLKLPYTQWTPEYFKGRELPTVSWAEVMGSQEGLLRWLELVSEYGFGFVHDTPATHEATRDLARRVAYIRESIFGGFWSFTTEMKHQDTAYSNSALDLHTDGTYSLDPPGLQMLHCTSLSGAGAESVLADGFSVAQTLREIHPEHFETLCEIAVSAQYLEEGVHLRAAHPVIRLTPRGTFEQICFNLSDRAPVHLSPPLMTRLYKALGAMRHLLQERAHQIRFTLTPGRVRKIRQQ